MPGVAAISAHARPGAFPRAWAVLVAWAQVAWLLLAAGPAAATDLPLGSGGGASRQAWASAAALSRGIGLGADVDAAADSPDAARFCAAAVRAGFRSVRLSVRLPLPVLSTEEAAWLQRLDTLVDGCLAGPLSVVLDLHEPLRPTGLAQAGAAAGPASLPWARRWQQLAARYAGRSPQLLFELSFAPRTPASGKQARLAQGLRAIRLGDRQRVVVIGWDDAIGLVKLVLPPDPHLIVAVHNDEPFRFTHQGVPELLPDSARWRGTGCCNPQEAQLLMLPLDLAQRWSQEHRYPVWLGRFRSYEGAPMEKRARHARLMREAAEARGLPWCYGDFSGGYGAHDAASGRWHEPLLRALVGP